MSELKPCPFCGGKNVGTTYKDTFSGDFRRGVYCADCCGGIYPYYDTEAEAIAAWNSRAERTCRNLDKHHNIMFKCSECGHWECQDFDGEKILPQTWNYCPNCGARVGE